MKFLYVSLLLAFKSVKNKILLLIAILTMAGILCQAIVFFAEQKLEDSGIRLDIGVVNHDDELTFILNIVLARNEVKDGFNVFFYDDYETASEKLKNGEIVAFTVIEEGFLASVLSGENMSPKVYINETSTLEAEIIEDLTANLSNMLRDTQSGIYTTLNRMYENYKFDADIMAINFDYINALLEVVSNFDVDGIEYVETMDITEHYILSIGIYLLFLTTGVFFNELCFRSQLTIFKQIHTVKKSYQILYFARVFMLFLLYLLLFIALSIFIGAKPSFEFIISLLNSALFFVLFQSLVFNIFDEYLPAIQINFFVHTLYLIVSGGVVPLLLMPKIFEMLSFITPIYYIRNLLSVGIVDFDEALQENIIIFIVNLMIIYIVYTLNLQKTKETRWKSNV